MNRAGSRQDYETPNDLMVALKNRFGELSWDLAASFENRKANLFFDVRDNSLSKNWDVLNGILWLNPPFDNISPWAKKCAESAKFGTKILFLTPASVGANWFRDHVHNKALVLALNGRLTFVGAKDPYPKDCILSCYGFGKGFEVWKWK